MVSVIQSPPSAKAEFIRKTYTHLAGAVAAFVVLEWLFFQLGIAASLLQLVASSQYAWLAILGGFMVLGWIARGLASRSDDINLQYAGLALYVVGESLLFAPLLYIAAYYSDPTVIPTAAILTLLMFAGLTTIAFTTRKDFSFLGGVLKLTGFVALGLIVCSILFDFTLGLVFSVGMVAFASAAILYDTSKVMHHYQPHQYVAASLQLFASVALLFWYILRIVMRARR
ncbi:MAG: Bax inhibitor-1 family protein [Cyanobacteria bacterium P01_G01_bin.4]